MNTKYEMILIKGRIRTADVESCVYDQDTQKWDVKFNNGKIYSYGYVNVEKLTEPVVLNPDRYRISREGKTFFDIKTIYEFKSKEKIYWHICFGDGSERDYCYNELDVTESCLFKSSQPMYLNI